METREGSGIGDRHPLDDGQSVLDDWPEMMATTMDGPEEIEAVVDEGSEDEGPSGTMPTARGERARARGEGDWLDGGQGNGGDAAEGQNWTLPMENAWPPECAREDALFLMGSSVDKNTSEDMPEKHPQETENGEAAHENAAFFMRETHGPGERRENAQAERDDWPEEEKNGDAARMDAETAKGVSLPGGSSAPIQVDIHVESPVFEIKGEGDVINALQSKAGELAELVATALAERMRDVLSNMTEGGG